MSSHIAVCQALQMLEDSLRAVSKSGDSQDRLADIMRATRSRLEAKAAADRLEAKAAADKHAAAEAPPLDTSRAADAVAAAFGWRSDWATGAPYTWETMLEAIAELWTSATAFTKKRVQQHATIETPAACTRTEIVRWIRRNGVGKSARELADSIEAEEDQTPIAGLSSKR